MQKIKKGGTAIEKDNRIPYDLHPSKETSSISIDRDYFWSHWFFSELRQTIVVQLYAVSDDGQLTCGHLTSLQWALSEDSETDPFTESKGIFSGALVVMPSDGNYDAATLPAKEADSMAWHAPEQMIRNPKSFSFLCAFSFKAVYDFKTVF